MTDQLKMIVANLVKLPGYITAIKRKVTQDDAFLSITALSAFLFAVAGAFAVNNHLIPALVLFAIMLICLVAVLFHKDGGKDEI